MESTQQQSQVAGTSWLSRGVASPGNLILLLASFALFPFVGKWTDAFALGSVALDSPMHTRAIVKFCLFLMVFEWAWFFIAWFGIRRFGKVTLPFWFLMGHREGAEGDVRPWKVRKSSTRADHSKLLRLLSDYRRTHLSL